MMYNLGRYRNMEDTVSSIEIDRNPVNRKTRKYDIEDEDICFLNRKMYIDSCLGRCNWNIVNHTIGI